MWNVLFLGLVNWITTTIVVESELFRPLRECIQKRRTRRRPAFTPPLGVNTMPGAKLPDQYFVCRPVWNKLAYLVSCHLCAGTWIALGEAATFGVPFHHGLLGVAAGGLLYKAIGHLVLELRPQAWARTTAGSEP